MKNIKQFYLVMFAFFFIISLQTFSQSAKNFPTMTLMCGNTATPDNLDEAVLVFVPDTTTTLLNIYSTSKMLNTDTMYPNIYIVDNNRAYAEKALPINGKGDTLIQVALRISTPGSYFVTVNSYENFDDSTRLYIKVPDDRTVTKTKPGATLFFKFKNKDTIENIYIMYYPSKAAVTGIKNLAKSNASFSTYVNNKELFLSYYNLNNNEGTLHGFSLTGSEVMQPVSIHNGTSRLAFDKPAGVYVMMLMTKDGTMVRKLVVAR